jgi:hypothetical protein
MATSQEDMTVGELVDGEDLEFLKALAAKRGVTIPELIKEGIQQVMRRRTRPKSMKGTLQSFRGKD